MPPLTHRKDEAVLILFTLFSIAMVIFGTVLNPDGNDPASISLV